jgi:hypothetical protein
MNDITGTIIYAFVFIRALNSRHNTMGKTHGVARFESIDGEFIFITCSISVSKNLHVYNIQSFYG